MSIKQKIKIHAGGIAPFIALASIALGMHLISPSRRNTLETEVQTQPATQNVQLMANVQETKDYNPKPATKDEIILAKMLYGEARNCSNSERAAIAFTAINRANDGIDWNGKDIESAILAKFQYSCFNANDPNRAKIMSPSIYQDRVFQDCLNLSREILSGRYSNLNFKQTHYHTQSVNPKWVSSPKMKRLGRIQTESGPSKHTFYKED